MGHAGTSPAREGWRNRPQSKGSEPMSDSRFSDPRMSDPRDYQRPELDRASGDVNAVWGWIAGGVFGAPVVDHGRGAELADAARADAAAGAALAEPGRRAVEP